jgi:branched-chain amino acid transport system permease protein
MSKPGSRKIDVMSVATVALIIAAVLAPMSIAGQTYLVQVLVLILIFATLAQAWNLLAGYTGQPSLGHATFFGSGAYTLALLTFYVGFFRYNPWPAIFIGGFIASIVGLAVGALCFRLRGPYFALATLAITEVIRLIVANTDFTQGALGVVVPTPPKVETPLFTIDFTEKLPYYYIALAIMLVSTYVVYAISKSRYGLMLQSIRDDEDATVSLGVNTFRLKMMAIFISAFMAGAAGALYAVFISYIDPSLDPGGVLTLFTSIDPILMTIIGGVGTIIGPIIGAAIKVGLGEYLRVTFGWKAGLDLVVFGAIFIAIFFVARRGIWGVVKTVTKEGWGPVRADLLKLLGR